MAGRAWLRHRQRPRHRPGWPALSEQAMATCCWSSACAPPSPSSTQRSRGSARRGAAPRCCRPRRRRSSRRTAACTATWSRACRSKFDARTAPSVASKVRLIDFDDPDANDWLAVNQFTVIENKTNRRPDVVVFVNGLPLGVIELKNPGDENATLDGAFNQLQTYKTQIPSLFRTNAAAGDLRRHCGAHRLADGRPRAVHALAHRDGRRPSRPRARRNWRRCSRACSTGAASSTLCRTSSSSATPDGDVDQDPRRLSPVPRRAAARWRARWRRPRPSGDRKVGVIWHTQGSGKSLLMAFYAGPDHQAPGDGRTRRSSCSPTATIWTTSCSAPSACARTCCGRRRSRPTDRDDLRKLLDRPSGGVIFTTIQKFSPEEGATDYPGADRPPQRRRDRRRGAPQPVRLPRQGREQDRRDRLRLRQVPARRACPTPPSSASPARPSRRTT